MSSPFGHPGNKHGVKLKSPDIRQIAYKSFCDHLAKGKAADSWYFEHEELTCTYRTFMKYLKDEAEFPPIKKDVAWNKGYQHWEGIVQASADGTNKKANTATLQMVMRNKFGWDRDNKKEDEEKPNELNIQAIKELAERDVLIDKLKSELEALKEKSNVQPQAEQNSPGIEQTPELLGGFRPVGQDSLEHNSAN